jgi:hypothetical protein
MHQWYRTYTKQKKKAVCQPFLKIMCLSLLQVRLALWYGWSVNDANHSDQTWPTCKYQHGDLTKKMEDSCKQSSLLSCVVSHLWHHKVNTSIYSITVYFYLKTCLFWFVNAIKGSVIATEPFTASYLFLSNLTGKWECVFLEYHML